MSGPLGSSQWMYATGAAVEGQSLRFNDNDSAYLSWTPAAAGNRKTWTWSGWVKRGNLPSSVVYLFGNSNGSNQGFHVRFDSGDTLTFLNYPSSASGQLTTSRVFRDTSAWYHIVLVWDTTNATSGDRMRMYINGERETAFGTASYPSLNLDGTWNSTSYGDHAIGRNNYNGRYFDGYLAEVNFVDGTAYDASYFGETDANGQWVPIKEPSVTYGTNGFYLPFTNDYEVEGFNTVTWKGNGGTQYIGGVGFKPDLVWIKSRSTTYDHQVYDSVRGVTKRVFPNKTDAELTGSDLVQSFDADGFTIGTNVGLNSSSHTYVGWAWDAGTVTNFVTNGDFDQDISNWSTTQGTATWDAASRSVYLQGPSGVSIEQTIAGLDTSKTYYYTARLRRTSGTGNFGVDVDGTLDYVSGSSYTNYTASGFFTPSSSSITFEVWGGTGLYLYADDIEVYEANTDGSITSTVKANPDYGFSIVSYTGTGSAATIGHGLTSQPEMVIIKRRGAAIDWVVYTDIVDGSWDFFKLHTNDTKSNSGVFSADTDTLDFSSSANVANISGAAAIAYCFHSVAGYSDFGSYSGNGSSTGPTVTTGFAPAFVMIKRTDALGGWIMFDNTRTPYNPLDKYLRADINSADVTASAYKIDFNSDGFQLKGTGNDINSSSGTYVYMAFADKREAAFYLDQSGNNNDWTNNNMQESDISLDNPTNNFATLNPLSIASGETQVLEEGNLNCTNSSSNYGSVATTIGASSGKWYCEGVILTSSAIASSRTGGGVLRYDDPRSSYIGAAATGWGYGSGGVLYNLGNNVTGVSTLAVGDVFMLAIDIDAGKMWIGKNGTWESSGDPAAGTGAQSTNLTGAGEYFFGAWSYTTSDNTTMNFGQDSSFAGNKVAQGNTDENGFGDFYYEPPAGYLALCTQNLPDPAIADGSEYFNTVLYTGNGSTQSITGVGFQPDFVWGKIKSATSNHRLHDVVRGSDNTLASNDTGAEVSGNGIVSFDSDGWTMDSGTNINQAFSYAAWSWKAGGTGVANTDGYYTSNVSANPDAGFSIIEWTGDGTAGGTVGHGLTQAPELWISRRINTTDNWLTYFTVVDGSLDYVYLNLSNSASNSGLTLPTSTVFSDGLSSGTSDDRICYAFHSVEGYSKIGSFTGNGSTNGTLVYTGFKPSFILWKRSSATSNWLIWDNTRSPYNVVDDVLFPDISNAESSSAASYGIDMLSNGFKLRNSNATVNGSGSTYIYMAFAESPFKYSNAR